MHLILDRYEVLKTLGRGGMADILHVKDRALSNQPVALKRCHNASLNPQLVREFFTLRSVQHPSLPTVFDFHSDLGDGRAGYTLEVVNGDTVDRWSRSASPEDLHSVFVDVLRALSHVHGQGLVHGDLHPQNILVCQKEDGRIDVKVLDLSPPDDERLEHAAMPFLAPERLAGEPATAASDLFSFGVCMYQLITGMLPYPDYPHIDKSSFPKASKKLGRLHDLVTALLAPQARQRPASAGETLSLLAAQLDQEIEPFTAMAVNATLQAGPTIPIGDWPASVIASVTSKLQGSGGLLAVCGGLGTGKTRVLDEIRWHLQGYTDAQVLDVQASRVVTDGAIIRELIPQIPKSVLNKLPETMAELAEIFVTGDAITDDEVLDQNHSRRRLCDQLAQLFLAVSAQQPLAIIVDDYISQDSLSTDVFCALLRALVHTEFQSHGVCLVVSGEDREDMARLVDPAVKVATIVTPPTFGYDATCRLISSTFAGLAASHELATELHSGTAGNPRYTIETLSHAFRKGWLQNLSATLSLTTAAPRPLPIPTSIIDALESRLSSLPKEQLEILSFLHFCELDVPTQVVSSVFTPLLGQLNDALENVRRHQLVRLHITGRHTRIRLASVHVAAACESLDDSLKPYLLRALANHSPTTMRGRVLATAASLALNSKETNIKAQVLLDELLAKNAFADALKLCKHMHAPPLAQYGEVLARAGRVGDALKTWRQLPKKQANLHIARLQLRQGRYREGLDRLTGYSEALAESELPDLGLLCARAHLMLGEYDKALATCERCAPDLVRWLQPTYRWIVGLIHFYRGQYDDASQAFCSAKEAFQRTGNTVQEANVYNAIGLLHYRKNDLKPAFEAFTEALSLGERANDRERVLLTLMNIAIIHQVRGNWRLAENRYVEALRMARLTGNRTGITKVLQNLGNLRRHTGHLDTAVTDLEESLELAEEDGNVYLANHNRALLGEVAWLQGNFQKAIQLLKRSITSFLTAGNVGEAADTKSSLAEVYLSTGEYLEAKRLATEAFSTAEELGQTRLSIIAASCLAHAHLASGAPAEALATARQSQVRIPTDERPEVIWKSAFSTFCAARAMGEVSEAMAAAKHVVTTLDEAAVQVSESERPTYLAVRDRSKALAETRWLTQLAEHSGPDLKPGEPLSRLLAVNERLVSELNTERLLEYIIDSAILLTSAERGFLLMKDEANGNPSVVVARNIDRENIRNKKLKVSYSIATQVISTGEGVLTTDAMGDERYTEYLSIHHLKLRSVLCLPMKRGNNVSGALYVDNRFQSSAFRKEDLPFMEAFTNQASIALSNAQLHQERTAALEKLAASQRQIERLNAQLQEQLDEKTRALEATEALLLVQSEQLSQNHGYTSIIGESPPMRRLFGILDRLCSNDISVLVTGESGTGKEVVAKAIHYNGKRQGRAFVAVNCSSIPESLIESELFGHVRGAFTGATADKKGMFEVAHRGTLFLDEIGEMPIEMQAKLLRALQEGEVQKVGGTRPVKVDVRVLAATNRNLREMIQMKTFREDLYYRLAVVSLELPPLRRRSEDIPMLIQHFIGQNLKDGLSTVSGISKSALQLLMLYQWPGNVRELQTVIKNASIFADSNTLQPSDLSNFPHILNRSGTHAAKSDGLAVIRPLADLERDAIIHALEQNKGNKKKTAEMLGIDRRTLYNKLSAYGVSVERHAAVKQD